MFFNYFDLSSDTDFQYLLDSIGQDVSINSSTSKALITNTNVEQYYDDKYISTLTSIKRGDIVDYDNQNWLIVSEVNGKRFNKYKGIMRVLEYDVNFNFSGDIKTFPTSIDSKTFDIEQGKYISLPDGKILVTLQENIETLKIELDQRFIKMGSAWKVTGINRTHKGLIILSCDLDIFNVNDNRELEIADYYAYVDTFTVAILDNNPLSIKQGDSYQLNVETRKNDTIDNTIPLTYSSLDTTIASVDSNGLITTNNYGTVTITVSKADDSSVFDTITVNVQDITIAINGQTALSDSISYTYTASVTNNGVVDNTAIANWSIDYNGNTSDVASLDVTNGNSVTLTTSTTTSTIYLVAKWQDDETIMTSKELNITSTSGGGGW